MEKSRLHYFRQKIPHSHNVFVQVMEIGGRTKIDTIIGFYIMRKFEFAWELYNLLNLQTFLYIIDLALTLSVLEPHLCLCKQVGSRPATE